MNRVYIQKTDFSFAEDIYNILDLRVINVSAIENISENDNPFYQLPTILMYVLPMGRKIR